MSFLVCTLMSVGLCRPLVGALLLTAYGIYAQGKRYSRIVVIMYPLVLPQPSFLPSFFLSSPFFFCLIQNRYLIDICLESENEVEFS